MADIFDMTDTWNDGATTFTAIKMNATDTASAAASLLMDLQVGGASRFRVQKNGYVFSSYASVSTGANEINLNYYQSGVGVSSVGAFTFSSSGTNAGNPDLYLVRDAADTLALRRTTNAQAFRLYNTYTDASNYERGFMRWTSNVLEIGTEAAGTGTARTLNLGNTGATTTILSANGGLLVTVGGGTFNINREHVATGAMTLNHAFRPTGIYLVERTAPSAPPTDNVVIYAEDNGSGKTRLMALFQSGAAQQIAIEP